MPIDDLLGEMHRDDARIIQTLQGKIEDQRAQRRDASLALISTLKAQVKELREQEFLLLPEGGMADHHRQERSRITQMRMEKELSLAHEQIQFLRDLQPTLMYDLHLTREQLEGEHEQQRFERTFYDA